MKYDDVAKRFWDNVNEIRLHRRLTWEELGNSIGTTGASLSTMRNMNRTPTIGYAMEIANALKVSLEELCITGRNTEESVDDDRLALLAILSAIAKELSMDDLLTLIKLGEHFTEAHPSSSSSSEPSTDSGEMRNKEIVERLKRLYL